MQAHLAFPGPIPQMVNPRTLVRTYDVLLADAARHGGTSAMSSQDIAEQLGDVSARTVRRALNALEQSGCIVIAKRRLEFYSPGGQFGWVENAIVVKRVASGAALDRVNREKESIRRRHERYVAAGRARPRRPRTAQGEGFGQGAPAHAGD